MQGFDFRKPPTTRDGRVITLSSVFGDALDVYFGGRGDDAVNGSKLRGARLDLKQTGDGENSLTWQYIKRINVSGGQIMYKGANFGDWVRYEIYAPATVGTSNVGAGVYDKYDLGGGANMYIPNATQEGDWDLNLTENYNANTAFTKVVPVPASDNDGYFDYDFYDDTADVYLNTGGSGNAYLFDFDCVLIEIANDVGILGDGVLSFTVPASYGAKGLTPHWKHKVTINHEGSGDLETTWHMFAGRMGATP